MEVEEAGTCPARIMIIFMEQVSRSSSKKPLNFFRFITGNIKFPISTGKSNSVLILTIIIGKHSLHWGAFINYIAS